MSSLLWVSRRDLEVSGGHCSIWEEGSQGEYRGRCILRPLPSLCRLPPPPAQHVLGAGYSPLRVRSHSSLPPAPAPGHSRCVPAEGQTAGDTQVHLISDDQIALPRSPKLKDVFAPGFDFRVFPGWSGEAIKNRAVAKSRERRGGKGEE